MTSLVIIKEGFSEFDQKCNIMRANCSCTIVRSSDVCIIVDPLTAWDKDYILQQLKEQNLNPDDITHVVCTHGHSDHIGNLNLFLKAIHIVGQSISCGTDYFIHSFDKTPYKINSSIQVIATPGHTHSDVSVVVLTETYGTVVIAGDLFERKEDIQEPSLWREIAGSENPKLQLINRQRILDMADYIIPGHGPMFKVTADLKHAHSSLLLKES
ncbi:metallo-beta-lactamase domain-containing protein 1-like [Centruroides sculpturatus]|uniref:metallo-beta-lactamase domain-containing protein 1-like n=1 Tax=Centruroides sculpturatus TaxID=218467 RepID=UPI000C6E42C7|nr:metallo-beta-lactamase domain-containing protein 1-like [Centruroides sculpturatus]